MRLVFLVQYPSEIMAKTMHRFKDKLRRLLKGNINQKIGTLCESSQQLKAVNNIHKKALSCKIRLFEDTVNSFKLLNTFKQSPLGDVPLGSECAFAFEIIFLLYVSLRLFICLILSIERELDLVQ